MNLSTKINFVLGGCAIKELGKNVIVFTSKEIKNHVTNKCKP